MPSPNESSGMTYRIAPDVIRVATGRVCGSQIFHLAKQQEKLLRFLVDEDLAGRAKQGSRAAVIAKFYADRSEGEAAQKLTWAMARLSEKLTEYYDGDGADDPIRVFVDPRSCGLRFEMWEAKPKPRDTTGPKTSMRMLILIGALIASAIGWVVMELTPTGVVEGPQDDWPKDISDLVTDDIELPMDIGGMSAVELIDHARIYQYPMLDFDRQKVAIFLSKTAMERDPDFAWGYATAAFSLASMADMTTGGGLSRRYLQEAETLSERSMSLAPNDSWVLASAAFVALASDDYETAVQLSKTAYATGGDDGLVAHAYAMIAHFTGRFEEVRVANGPDKIMPDDPIRLIRERVYAFASFHIGDHDTTVRVLEAGAESGEAHNIASMLYLAAAYQAAAQQEAAEGLVAEIQETWPTLRTEVVASMFFQDPNEGDIIRYHLSAAGMPFED